MTATKTIKCLNCSNKTDAGKSNGKEKKFCSTICKNQYHNKKREENRKKLKEILSKIGISDIEELAAVSAVKPAASKSNRQRGQTNSFIEERRNKKLGAKN